MLAEGHDAVVVRAARARGEQRAGGSPRVISYVPNNLYFYADDHKHGWSTRLLWHWLDMFNGGSAREFRRILAEEQPDVVHTHNLMGLGFLLPATVRAEAARRRRAGQKPLRHVHTVHDVQLLHPSGSLPANREPVRGAAQRVYVALMRMLMGSPDAVLFPSQFAASLHDRCGFFRRSRRVTLANPAPAPVADEHRMPARLTFTYVGQIERTKGVFVLLAAWGKAGLAASHGAALHFVGDGTAMKELHAATQGRSDVALHGKLTGDALTEQYERATFVVVPSVIIENQPTVILEAFSRGVPVAGSISGGIPEMVRNGETGFLAVAGDVDGLAAAMQKAAQTDSATYGRMSANARAWSAAHGRETHVAGLRAAYRVET